MRTALVIAVAIVIVGAGVRADDQYSTQYFKDITNQFKVQPIQPMNQFKVQPIQTSTFSYSSLPTSTVPKSPANVYSYGAKTVVPYSSGITSYSYANPASVIGPGGEYLGNTSSNEYDPNSINNPYGIYGSKYSPNSVNNPYGQFGSKYSTTSANNPYATDTPKLYGQGVVKYGAISPASVETPYNTPKLYGQGVEDYRGKLSANKYDPSSVENPYSVTYDKPLATNRQQLRQKIFSVYATNPEGFLGAFKLLSAAEQKTSSVCSKRSEFHSPPAEYSEYGTAVLDCAHLTPPLHVQPALVLDQRQSDTCCSESRLL